MTRATDPDADLTADLVHSRLLVDAPETVIERALQIFQARPLPLPATPSTPATPLRQQLAARLQFDSLARTAQATGVRSAAEATRQLLFSADGRDIDLRISAESDGWLVCGQVLGPDATGRAVLEAGAYRTEVAWNELCEFSFQGVPEGDATLTLRGSDWELVLPALRIQAEHGAG